MKINRKYSRNFLIAASAYRRCAKGFDGDFSSNALHEQYMRETHGKKHPVSENNGYAFGKWALEVTLKSMKEDWLSGLMCKRDLLEGSCVFIRRVVRTWFGSSRFFPYEIQGKSSTETAAHDR